ncbi:MAG: hypothetical protein K6A94_12045 [Bacteroidales bacterium]|nr:hypothetical protein [Bacteroidales bacterium]
MGPQEKITLIDREDLGPVLARADHFNNTIEVNKRAFYTLPPMVQEFVLCHEVCHLKHHEWDEGETNRLASSLFMSRAVDDDDRATRNRFLSYLDGTDTSNFDVALILSAASAALSLSSSIYSAIRNRNEGWYGWDDATRRANLETMLKQSFEESRRSTSQSAKEFFWVQLSPYTNRDDSVEEFLARTDHAWVKGRIAAYEEAYGFKFDEVTPFDLTAYPLLVVAIGALAAVLVYVIIKKAKK